MITKTLFYIFVVPLFSIMVAFFKIPVKLFKMEVRLFTFMDHFLLFVISIASTSTFTKNQEKSKQRSRPPFLKFFTKSDFLFLYLQTLFNSIMVTLFINQEKISNTHPHTTPSLLLYNNSVT